MSASKRGKTDAVATCLERMSGDTRRLLETLDVTNDDLVLYKQLADIKTQLDNIYDLKVEERMAFIEQARQQLQADEFRNMTNADLSSQAQELFNRLSIMGAAFEKLAPEQQQRLIILAKEMDNNNNLDAMNAGIDALNINSGAREEIKNLKEYFGQQSKRVASAASDAANLISVNGRSGVCLLMGLICSLPCKNYIVQALNDSHPNLANVVSDSLCMYWKIEALKILKIQYDNLSSEQMDQIIWALFGYTVTASKYAVKAASLCGDVCLFIYDRLISIMNRGAGGISSMLNLSNMQGFNPMEEDDTQPISDNSSADGSFGTAASQPSQPFEDPLTNYDFGILNEAIQNDLLERMSTATNPGSNNSSQESSQGDVTAHMITTVNPNPELNTFMKEEAKKRGRDDMPGGRRSRRYKKRRSTLKRRRMKRRRTRKGKKRRHTKRR